MYDSRGFHTEDPSKPEVLREERWGSEKQGYGWVDGRMKEGSGPMRHLELWCYWEICCVCARACARASEILPTSLWHSLLSLLCTRLCMKNNIHPLKEVQSLCPILVNIGFWTHYFHSRRRVQIEVDNTNHYSLSIIPSAIRLLKTYSILRDCKLPLNLVIWTTTTCFVDCYSLYWPL